MGKKASFGNLYEFNKIAYNKVTAIPADKAEEKFKEIETWFGATYGTLNESSGTETHYQMLLCRELSDYTVFAQLSSNAEAATLDLQDVVSGRGALLDVVYNSDVNAYEIWIRAKQDNDVHMYMLFRCDDFVIEY